MKSFIFKLLFRQYSLIFYVNFLIPECKSYQSYYTPCEIVNSLENLRPYNKRMNISRHNNMDNDCIELLSKYKTYIKEEYIK